MTKYKVTWREDGFMISEFETDADPESDEFLELVYNHAHEECFNDCGSWEIEVIKDD